MDFILDNDSTEAKFQDILKLIKLRQNGVTSTSMSNKGMAYDMNYGVSFTVLKELATRFEANNLLALKLWNHKWRETYILATLLADFNAIDIKTIETWTEKAPTEEILNHIATNLTVNMADTISIMSVWINSNIANRVIVACKTITKWTFKHKTPPESIKLTITSWIDSEKLITEPTLIRAIGDLIRTIGRFETSLRPSILKWAERQYKKTQSTAWEQKYLEIDAEFKYL